MESADATRRRGPNDLSMRENISISSSAIKVGG
jgi:hypothetical protein